MNVSIACEPLACTAWLLPAQGSRRVTAFQMPLPPVPLHPSTLIMPSNRGFLEPFPSSSSNPISFSSINFYSFSDAQILHPPLQSFLNLLEPTCHWFTHTFHVRLHALLSWGWHSIQPQHLAQRLVTTATFKVAEWISDPWNKVIPDLLQVHLPFFSHDSWP